MTPAPSRLAVIDVGTNSVKLLVADMVGKSITPVVEDSRQTRLGRGFYQAHRLQTEAVRHTAEAVARFADEAREKGAASVRVIGTSAARDAVNANELIEEIQRQSDLPLEIISGEQEAAWTLQGVTSDPALAGLPLLILDVGGGSTECVIGGAGGPSFQHSYPLGSVRLLERLRPSDPPGLAALGECRAGLRLFLDREIAPALQAALQCCQRPPQLVGTGGTATILARMEHKMTAGFDRAIIEATRLSVARVSEVLASLWQATHAERQQLPGLPPNRADVILFGTAIYEAVMEQFDLAELRVTTRGLRFAALRPGA